jgi:hypothetical protein
MRLHLRPSCPAKKTAAIMLQNPRHEKSEQLLHFRSGFGKRERTVIRPLDPSCFLGIKIPARPYLPTKMLPFSVSLLPPPKISHAEQRHFYRQICGAERFRATTDRGHERVSFRSSNAPLASPEAERPAGARGAAAPSSLGMGCCALGASLPTGGGDPAGAAFRHRAQPRRLPGGHGKSARKSQKAC